MVKILKKKMRRGGCGCNASKKPISISTQFGGNGFSMRNYYPAENYNNAPTNPISLVSARNLPNMQFGGKSRRSKNKKAKKTRKKRSIKNKKMMGGGIFLTNSMDTNPVASFGNFNWSVAGSNILTNTQNINPASYSQPVEKIYSAGNPALA